MNILIPMAGAGSRFSNDEWHLPKPLIMVGGKPMICSVLECMPTNANYIFIIRKYENQHHTEWLKSILNSYGTSCSIVEIDYVTDGAACTALLAEEYINNMDQLVITNCDQIFHDDVFNKFVDYCNGQGDDGIVMTHLSDDPKHSYVLTDDDGYAIRFAEKDVISQNALIGVHYWKRGDCFVRSAKKMISDNDKHNGEFYISGTYNHLIEEGSIISCYNITNGVNLVGTPDDVNHYESKVLCNKKCFLFDIDGVLIDTCNIQIQSTLKAIERFKLKDVHEDLVSSTVTTLSKLRNLADEGYIKHSDINEIYAIKKSIADRMVDEHGFEDKSDIFKYLDSVGIKYGFVTNGNKKSALKFLEKIGVLQFVRVLITNEDVISGKPHGEPYIKAANLAGFLPSRCVVIEDSITGVESASNAAIDVCCVSGVDQVNEDLIKELLRNAN